MFIIEDIYPMVSIDRIYKQVYRIRYIRIYTIKKARINHWLITIHVCDVCCSHVHISYTI